MSSTGVTIERWPAEWEPHARTWIAWPHQRDDWPGKFEPIPWVYTEIVRHLHRTEEVGILVNDRAAAIKTSNYLEHFGVDLARIAFHVVPTDRVWTRDSGPIFVKSSGGANVALDWGFNGWAKYENHHRDNVITEALVRELGWPTIAPTHKGRRAVLEGGSIDGNGAGLLLTTEECLLSDVQVRNPGFTRADYEQIFARYLAVKKVLWLGRGIVGDDTHGHIDDLARFVGPRTIVTVVEDNPNDDNYRPLQENLERLLAFTDLDGQCFEILTLPMPEPLYFDGQRLPASYANFYIANDRVLAPTFNAPQDRIALGVLAEAFPGRTVVGIHAVDLVWGLGTLHCLTQQEPR
jgi:agmatine deiminase